MGTGGVGTAAEEVREHDGLRRLGWVLVWIILGLLAFVALVALGHVVGDVARSVLIAAGMFGVASQILRPAVILLVFSGAIILVVVVLVGLVRARSVAHSPGGPGAFREALSLPVLVLAALLVLVWSAVYQSSGPWPPLFYLGIALLACGIALFATDPRLARSSKVITAGESESDGGAISTSRYRPRERKRRDRSHLGAFTVGALFIIVATLGFAGSFGLANIDVRIFPPLVLTVLAGGLLLGTWVGRARWLTILCVLTLPFVALANIIDVPVAGGVGSVTYSPRTAAELRSTYAFGAGNMTLDLSALKATDPNTTVVATLAAGELTVEVPQGVHVVIDFSVRAGQIETNGRRHAGIYRSGVNLSASTTYGSDSPGLIHLIVHCGVGTIRVWVPAETLPSGKPDPGGNGPKPSPGKGQS